MAQIARVDPNLRGLYECPRCHAEYTSATAATYCCDDD